MVGQGGIKPPTNEFSARHSTSELPAQMELAMRLERMTSPVPRVYSTNWAIQALEQETGVEPAPSALARRHSTNWITPAKMVGSDGVAPPEPEDSEFTARPATNYGITPHIGWGGWIRTTTLGVKVPYACHYMTPQ